MARNAPTGVRVSATSSRQTGSDRVVAGKPAETLEIGSDLGASRRERQRDSDENALPESVRITSSDSPKPAVEAGPLTGVAGAAALLVDGDQEGIAVAVVGGGTYPLAIA